MKVLKLSEENSVDGTSFHLCVISASTNKLIELFGEDYHKPDEYYEKNHKRVGIRT